MHLTHERLICQKYTYEQPYAPPCPLELERKCDGLATLETWKDSNIQSILYSRVYANYLEKWCGYTYSTQFIKSYRRIAKKTLGNERGYEVNLWEISVYESDKDAFYKYLKKI